MMKFMLDTDTVSYAMRGEGRVIDRLRAVGPSTVCISALTLAQLRYGAALRRSRKLSAHIDIIERSLTVAPFDSDCATRFGLVAAQLSHAGTPIGDFDALIASHALTRGLTLVTNNTKHFKRVTGLTLDNWLS